MSAELTKARSQLMQVKSNLKQEKIMAAVMSFTQGLAIILRTPLMRNEKEEFNNLVQDAVAALNSSAAFQKACPVQLEYTPGKEKELLLLLRELKEELEKSEVNDAQAKLAELNKQKAEALRKGSEMISMRQYDDALDMFRYLAKSFPDDTELKGEIGERFLKAQRYEEAYEFLAEALKQSPESIHLYNRIGIALRKMGRFEVAERYYAQALDYAKGDPNLYFNIGRLYIDWRKWDKVEKMARRAIKYKPDFTEAKKMLLFAQKKQSSP